MIELVAGALLGLAGSAHCVGMCGPLVLAVRGGFSSRRQHWAGLALYHAGRLLVYQVLAVVAALTGRAAAAGNAGRVLSIVCGVALLAAAFPVSARAIPARAVQRWMRLLSACSGWLRMLAAPQSLVARFGGGVINGLLPCGLVYAATAMAAASGRLSLAILVMAGFGAATLPALVLLPALDRIGHLRLRLRGVAPVALAAVGVLLVARGLASPDVTPATPHSITAHLSHRH